MEAFEIKQFRSKSDKRIYYFLFALIAVTVVAATVAVAWTLKLIKSGHDFRLKDLLQTNSSLLNFPSNETCKQVPKWIEMSKSLWNEISNYSKPDYHNFDSNNNKKNYNFLSGTSNFDLNTLFNIMKRVTRKWNATIMNSKEYDVIIDSD